MAGGRQDFFELGLKINGLMAWAKRSGLRHLSTLRAIGDDAKVIPGCDPK